MDARSGSAARKMVVSSATTNIPWAHASHWSAKGASLPSRSPAASLAGWCITRFFGSQQDAEHDYLLMCAALEAILHLELAGEDENADGRMAQMADAIATFVEQYP